MSNIFEDDFWNKVPWKWTFSIFLLIAVGFLIEVATWILWLLNHRLGPYPDWFNFSQLFGAVMLGCGLYLPYYLKWKYERRLPSTSTPERLSKDC